MYLVGKYLQVLTFLKATVLMVLKYSLLGVNTKRRVNN